MLLWLRPDGSVLKYQLLHTTGSPDAAQILQTAFADLTRVREAPPADMPMPIGLDINTQ